MKRTRKKNTLTQRGAYLKNRIARNRSRAQFTGIVYLLSIIAIAAVMYMPLFELKAESVTYLSVMEFWKVFTAKHLKSLNALTPILQLANGVLYALMLLGLVVNVLRSLGKLGWLFKRKASKSYGFNRNVYAMEDLGHIFSGSFAVVITVYFLISVINGFDAMQPTMWLYILLGGGAFIHLFAGVIGGKVSYFDIEDGEISEDKRVVGRFSAFFRNVLQLAAVGAIMYYFQKTEVIHTVIGPLLEKGGIKNYLLAEPMAYIAVGLQILTVLCILPLIKHATATTEYNIDGANGSGMKTFRVFSFFVFLTAGATAVCRYLLGEPNGKAIVDPYVSVEMIIVAAVALVMFIIEVIMRNMPRHPDAKKKKDEDIEADYEASAAKYAEREKERAHARAQHAHPSSPYANAPVYIVLDTKEKQAAAPVVVEEKKVEEPKVEEEVEEEVDVEEVVETNYNINCPHCGKALRVKSGPSYHRCPVCKKVFQVRKVTKDVIV